MSAQPAPAAERGRWLVPDFSVDGFWSAAGAAIIVFLVNWGLSAVLGLEHGRRREQGVR